MRPGKQPSRFLTPTVTLLTLPTDLGGFLSVTHNLRIAEVPRVPD